MMNLLLKTGVSPLQARASGTFYIAILAGIVIIGIAAVIWLILRKISNNRNTPEWEEAERNRPTKLSDIKNLMKQYSFTSEEGNLIFDICKESSCPNIYYSIHNNSLIDDIFRNYYSVLKAQNATEQHFSDFYKLRHKMEVVIAQKSKISSTLLLPVNSKLFFITEDSEQFPFTIISNIKNGITLEIPEFMFNKERRPEELKQAKFMYKATNGITYLFLARPIRYEHKDDKYFMVISHTSNLHSQAQRQFQREFVNSECFFSSCTKKAEKDDVIFVPNANKIAAKLVNISAGGCCIHCSLPIKEKQNICIYFPSLGIDENTIGVIRHTRIVPAKNLYALHIQFTQVTIEVQNKIYSFVYKYEL